MWHTFRRLAAGACDWAYQISMHRTSDTMLRFVARPILDTKVIHTQFELRHSRPVTDDMYRLMLGLAPDDIPQEIYYIGYLSSTEPTLILQPNFSNLYQDMIACERELLEFHRSQDAQPPASAPPA